MQSRTCDRKNLLGVLSILFSMAGCCCSSQNGQASINGSEIAKSVLSGFESPPSRLFVARGRLGELLTCYGYDAKEYSYYCDHSSDGTSLRCWNRDRTSAVVIQKGRQPRIITTPAHAFLDDQGNVVAHLAMNYTANHKITFQNGTEILAPEFTLSAGGRAFCFGGDYYEYKTQTRRTSPIKLAFAGNPQKTVATSELQGLLAGVFAAGNNIYVVARDSNRLACEEYEQDGSAVVSKRRFDISPPAKLAIAWVVPADFDPASNSFLIKVGRDLPLLGGPLWYVYDIKTDKFREVGVFEGYAGFLDRHIFDRTLEGLSNQPSQQK